MKKRELRRHFDDYVARTKASCEAVGHPRPAWRDRSEEVGHTFWSRESCPCGKTGDQGRNFAPPPTHTDFRPCLRCDWMATTAARAGITGDDAVRERLA